MAYTIDRMVKELPKLICLEKDTFEWEENVQGRIEAFRSKYDECLQKLFKGREENDYYMHYSGAYNSGEYSGEYGQYMNEEVFGEEGKDYSSIRKEICDFELSELIDAKLKRKIYLMSVNKVKFAVVRYIEENIEYLFDESAEALIENDEPTVSEDL